MLSQAYPGDYSGKREIYNPGYAKGNVALVRAPVSRLRILRMFRLRAMRVSLSIYFDKSCACLGNFCTSHFRTSS